MSWRAEGIAMLLFLLAMLVFVLHEVRRLRGWRRVGTLVLAAVLLYGCCQMIRALTPP